MNKEIEIRFLEIDKEAFIREITSIGAVSCGQEMEQVRYIYDFKPANPNKWIRLRSNGKKNTLTIKEIVDTTSVDGTNEWEIEVSSIETTNEILEQLGYHYRNIQENKRQLFKYNDVEITIETWPLIPPYAEVEAKSKESLEQFLKLLNFEEKQMTTLDVESIFREKYSIDIKNIKRLTFGE